jgi:hypothetical protein
VSDLESLDLTATPHLTEEKPDREGLPSSYRMRADTHYVDLLTSRREVRAHAEPRTEPTMVADPRAATTGRGSEPPERGGAGEPRNRRGDRVLDQLADDLATLQSAVVLIAGERSALARRVGVDLIHSHAWRASWLLRAHQILEGQRPAQMRPHPIGPIFQQIRDGLDAECRLTGSQLHVSVCDWNEVVDVDEDGLAAGVTGAVLATLGLSGDREALSVRISATVTGGELSAIEVTQDTVRVGPMLSGRFFDMSWIDRPGGRTASLGAAIAHAIGHRLGGDVVFFASDRSGSTIRFTFHHAVR